MNKEKEVMKFDTGADGFLKMIYVLVGFAVLILIVGFYFIITNF